MDTKTELAMAQQIAQDAAKRVKALKKKLKDEESFKTVGMAYLVIRRCIDTGRMTNIEGVFNDRVEATRFAHTLAGYGLGKDIHIVDKPLKGVLG